MADDVEHKPPEQVRGRPFPKGRSGNPAGRRFGSRNKATMAAPSSRHASPRSTVFEPYNLKRRSRCRPAAGAAGRHKPNNPTWRAL